MPEGKPSREPSIVQETAETLEGTEALSPSIRTLYENYNRSPRVKELDRLEPEYNAWVAESTIGRGDILDRYNRAERAVKPLRDPINERNRKRYPDALGIDRAQLEDLVVKSQTVREAYTSLRNRLFDWERRVTPSGPPLESAEADVLKALERFNNAIAKKIPNFVAKDPQEIITKLSDELSAPTHSEPLSPMDTSPEALVKRYKKRKEWRESAEGITAKALRDPTIKIFEREKEKTDSPKTQNQEGQEELLANAILALEQRLARGEAIDRETLEIQKEQLESWIGGGYDSFVSTENAQVAIDPRYFETSHPAWYRSLSEKWQEVIRARTAIMMSCYLKRARGHTSLEAIAENPDMRIDRDSLDVIWREMPGFRIAVATIIRDFFEITKETPMGFPATEENTISLMVLNQEAKKKEGGNLETFAEYKRKLVTNLESHFEDYPNLLATNEGAPQLSPRTAARAAIAAAWNLIFAGHAVDSGDQGNLSKEEVEKIQKISEPCTKDLEKNPTVGRGLKNPIVYAEQARAMMLPYDKAWGKFVRAEEEKVGTEETWLEKLGNYVAERCRHDPQFRKEFFQRTRRIIPQRLFASWFDLTTFKEKYRDKDGKEKSREVSVGEKLCGGEKSPIGAGELCDFNSPNVIDFTKLESSELWGGYADTFDSARKIYEMIGNGNPLTLENTGKWSQTLATALSKLRKTPLAPYYRDPNILISCIAGSVGLVEFTNNYLLASPEQQYDVLVNLALNDDRLFKGMEKGSRNLLLKKLNANDHYSYRGMIRSVFHVNRATIRKEASAGAKKFRAE